MITILSGTNREHSMTLKIATIIHGFYQSRKIPSQICDLGQLPGGLFEPHHYGNPPPEFLPFQDMILEAAGLMVVIPEYNGGMPGVLKYFIDLLKFPESLRGQPAAFVGVAAGQFGAMRPIEQLEMVFQYRQAHLYGKRVMFMNVAEKLDTEGVKVKDNFTRGLLEEMLQGFSDFVRRLKGPK